MRILHVLSQTELTGSEVYAAHLGCDQISQGHEVFYISDKLHVAVPGRLYPRAISKRSWPQRLGNIRFLKKFIAENKIDLVHAHSRASSWVSYWATRSGPTAYISTVHGRQHLHRSLQLYSVYGDRVIAVCRNVKEHLAAEAGIESERLRCIPNGLDFSTCVPPSQNFPKRLKFTILGRTTGPKGKRASEIIDRYLPGILKNYPNVDLEIAGGLPEKLGALALAQLDTLQAEFPGRIRVRGYLPADEITSLIHHSSLVVASGRLAIYSVAAGTPTIALGEAACHGLVSEENLESCMHSNFGDMLAHTLESVDHALLEKSLLGFFAAPEKPAAAISARVRSHFALGPVSQQVMGVYFEALTERRLPKQIPILMYHKVVKEGFSSPHKTYIPEDSFAAHMRGLTSLGFTTVTFKDLENAAIGKAPLPAKPVILTFDDGYRGTHRRALPMMKEQGHRGVFYLLGDRRMDQNSWDPADEESALISDEELQELCDAGHEIGAHSMSHRHMSKLGRAEALQEATDSKAILEKLTGQRIVSYAYPYGDICGQSKDVVREAGFSFAVATDSGGRHFSQDLFHLFRVNIFPQDGILQLFKKTHSSYRPYYAWKRGK